MFNRLGKYSVLLQNLLHLCLLLKCTHFLLWSTYLKEPNTTVIVDWMELFALQAGFVDVPEPDGINIMRNPSFPSTTNLYTRNVMYFIFSVFFIVWKLCQWCIRESKKALNCVLIAAEPMLHQVYYQGGWLLLRTKLKLESRISDNIAKFKQERVALSSGNKGPFTYPSIFTVDCEQNLLLSSLILVIVTFKNKHEKGLQKDILMFFSSPSPLSNLWF